MHYDGHAVQPVRVCTHQPACVCALYDTTEDLVAAVAVVTVDALLVLLLLLSLVAEVLIKCRRCCTRRGWCLCGDFNALS